MLRPPQMRALAARVARVVVQRRQARQLGRARIADAAQLGHEGHHRRAGVGANALDALEALVQLLEVLVQMRADVLVQRGDLLVQGLDHRVDALAQHAHRPTSPVHLGGTHVHELAPAQHHGLQRLARARAAGRQPHTGLIGLVRQGVRVVRQGQRVDGVGLGQVAHAARELARRARVDHRHRQAQLQQQARPARAPGRRWPRSRSGPRGVCAGPPARSRSRPYRWWHPVSLAPHAHPTRSGPWPCRCRCSPGAAHRRRLHEQRSSYPILARCEVRSGNCSGLATNASACTPHCSGTSSGL